jgi:hypothetical protein
VRRRAIAIIATCLVLAGCGGGHQATKQDVVSRANAICAGALRDIRALPSPATAGGSNSGLAKYLQQVVPIVHKEVANLGALPRPARDRSVLTRYLAAMADVESNYRALLAAARSGDAGAVSDTLSTLAASPAAGLAERYGLTQCASASGTAVS